MSKIASLIRRLVAWLTAIDRPLDTIPAELCWSDLPSHHPAADIHCAFIGRPS